MKAMKSWMLGMAAAIAVLVPLQGASAWDHQGGGYGGDRGGGYYGHRGGYGGGRWGGGYYGHRGGYGGGRWGGGYYGHRGGYYGYRGGYYGYRGGGGCWNCGSAGAAVAGLAIGTLVGAAMIDASRPLIVVAPPPPAECRSVRVNGVLYSNCDGY